MILFDTAATLSFVTLIHRIFYKREGRIDVLYPPRYKPRLQENRLFSISRVLPPVGTLAPVHGHSSLRDMNGIGKNTSIYPGTSATVVKKAFLHWYIQTSHMGYMSEQVILGYSFNLSCNIHATNQLFFHSNIFR
jgi:hypothetical protein